MKKEGNGMAQIISYSTLIATLFVMTGCGQNCNPTYLSNSAVFKNIEKVNGLPIRIKTEDSREIDEKYFLKLGFITYHETDSKDFNEYQTVKLARPSKEIVQSAFDEGFKRCGFTLNDNAYVVANITLKKFLCTISGSKDNEAVIEFDLSLKENDTIIYHKSISETYRQKFNAFRQNEDAEPLLSKCLTMAIDNTLASPEFTNQIAANAQSFQLMPAQKETLITSQPKEEKVIGASPPTVKLDGDAQDGKVSPNLNDNFTTKQTSKAELLRTGKVCFPEYDPAESRFLFEEIQKKYMDCSLSPMLLSEFSEDCCLIIFIPIDEYRVFSLDVKKKIMNYVSSLIPDVKKHPYSYSIIPSTAPIFKMKPNILEKYTGMMSYRSCAIAVGPIEEGNYYKGGGEGEYVFGKYVAEEQLISPDDLK